MELKLSSSLRNKKKSFNSLKSAMVRRVLSGRGKDAEEKSKVREKFVHGDDEGEEAEDSVMDRNKGEPPSYELK